MKVWQNQSGFTLIEMMIVLLVISVLLLVTIPNVTKNNSEINSKGCEAYVQMVQTQVQAYEIKHQKLPNSIDSLVEEGYLFAEETACPNGDKVNIAADGRVSKAE